jgi:hypothetical protein
VTPAQARVRGALLASGENYLAGGVTRRAVFSLLRPGQARDYLSDADILAAGRPLRLAHVPYDDPTTPGTTLTFGGVSQTVVKTLDLRYLSAVVGRVLVLT